MTDTEFKLEVAQKIMHHLDEHDIKYEYDEENDIIHFGTAFSGGGISNIHYFFRIKNTGFVVIGKIPFDANITDSNSVKRMNEFMCRVNCNTIRSAFQFDCDDGEIRCQYYINCTNMELSDEMIKNSISIIYKMYKQYAKGILATMFSDRSVREIIEECEDDDSFINDLLAKIRERESKKTDTESAS